jgi:glycosyltransferase involved in cell wall biosynthesis
MAGFEENEISIKSNGGTELIKRGVASRLPEKLTKEFQVICSKIRELDQSKIRIYWIHDLPEDPELAHLKQLDSRNRLHHFVFCGQWQYYRFQHHLNMPYDLKTSVIENAIEPIPYQPKNFDNKIRMVYSSTPQRGLEILVPVFEELAKKYPNIHLDVFSSFKIYGWDEYDKMYEPLYDRIRNHPQMTYHGFKPNSEVKEAFKNAHIFAYPSIWLECNSISLIEAMSSGLYCVHPNYGGLIDTSANMTYTYQGSSDINQHANVFYHSLDHAINSVQQENTQNYLKFVKSYADLRFNFDKITSQWEKLMEMLLEKYPSVESRKIPEKMFTYST